MGQCNDARCCAAAIADDVRINPGLSEVSNAQAPWVDWRALAGFRNVLVHDYLGGVDIERVWDAVEIHLPELEQAVRGLKALNNELGSDSPR